MGATQALIQEEIIRAVVNAKNKGGDIKQTIKALAKEFGITEHVVKAVVEMNATYGLEKVGSEKTEGKLWQRMDYTKAIKRLEDKVYKLQAEIVRTNNRITRELGLREPPWARRKLSSFEVEGVSLESQEDEEIPRRQILLKAHEDIEPEQRGGIEALREKIDRARSRLDGKESLRLTFRGLKELGD